MTTCLPTSHSGAPVRRIVRRHPGDSPARPRPATSVSRHELGPGLFAACFSPPAGAREVHLRVEPDPGLDFAHQLRQVEERYALGLAALGLDRTSALFRRVLLSDAANQLEPVMASTLGCGAGEQAAAVSAVEQPVLPFRKLALQAWHAGGIEPADKRLVAHPAAGRFAHTLVVRRPRRTLLLSAQLGAGRGENVACRDQTRELLLGYEAVLDEFGARPADHLVRTWLYVDGIDRNYLDVVAARRECFLAWGLNPDTHYVVSTGIQGRDGRAEDLVLLDALAIAGLDPEQIWYVDALDRLNRTSEYGVTFERAARLDHGDRSHLLVAGTASIDGAGRIVHPGDFDGQLERTIGNIAALLEAAGAGLEDLVVATVYLRDPADIDRCRACLAALVPGLLATVVLAPVCRPGWLVEIEGIAAVANDDPRWPRFG